MGESHGNRSMSEHRIPLSAMCRPHKEEGMIDYVGRKRGSYGFLQKVIADLEFERRLTRLEVRKMGARKALQAWRTP